MNNFIESAKQGKNEWWRYVLTIAILPLFFIIGSIPRFVLLKILKIRSSQLKEVNIYADVLTETCIHLSLVIGIFIGLKYIHKRKILSLFTASKQINFKKIIFSFTVFIGLYILFEILKYVLYPTNYILNTNVSNAFIAFIVVTFVYLVFQILSEELLDRSYILQSISIGTKRIWISIFLTSIIFTVSHFGNYGNTTNVVKYTSLFTIFFGSVIIATIVVWDEGIELAYGWHMANNFYLLIMVSSPNESHKQNAIVITKNANHFFLDSIVSITIFLLFILICSWRYRWKIKKNIRNIFIKINKN